MMFFRLLALSIPICSAVYFANGAETLALTIDFSQTNGVLRPLHGINRGPLVAGGFIDLTDRHRALGIPFTRLHDSHWPNSDVVDIHAVFPDFSRDPEKPESYDFVRTDEYLAAIHRSGARIVYRLGESIEHEKTKRFVHPPRDPKKWAQICVGIIRHYNDGWANGFRYNIQYWEIWNEPENRPVMWTGTDEQFLELYAVAAREIKGRYPHLKVGGPGFGYTGEIIGGELRPGGLLTNFLARCQREALPLNFLSWHCYTDDPHELVVRARGMRRFLDARGFAKTESHLNEWNYLPGRTWKPISKTSGTPESRQAFYAEMSGPAGAAFIAAALIELQDAPVDVSNLFHGEVGPFGLFNEHGVPQKNFYALQAFKALLNSPVRVRLPRDQLAGTVAAGVNQSQIEATILVVNLDGPHTRVEIACRNLPWSGATHGSVRVIDATHNLAAMNGALVDTNGLVTVPLRKPSVALVSLRGAP